MVFGYALQVINRARRGVARDQSAGGQQTESSKLGRTLERSVLDADMEDRLINGRVTMIVLLMSCGPLLMLMTPADALNVGLISPRIAVRRQRHLPRLRVFHDRRIGHSDFPRRVRHRVDWEEVAIDVHLQHATTIQQPRRDLLARLEGQVTVPC